MTTYILSEIRLHLDSVGDVRAKHGAAAYAAWEPFVRAFGSVTVVARVDTRTRSDTGPIVTGPSVQVLPLPYYHGGVQAVLGALRIKWRLRSVGSSSDVFIGRVPELVSLLGLSRGRSLKAKTVAMVVADPGVIREVVPGWRGRILGRMMLSRARSAVFKADAVTYVSQQHFQAILPAGPGIPTFARSNVVVDDDWLLPAPRTSRDGSPALRLVSVGSLEHRAKGMDHLVRVVAGAREHGLQLSLTIIGGGRLSDDLQRLALSNSVDVVFTGHLGNRSDLKRHLDIATAYVSGSRSEGLPRATIEAMARGLPAVSTNAGAARELLSDDFIVPPDDVDAFVAALKRLEDPDCWQEQSARNLEVARGVLERADPSRLARFFEESVVSRDGVVD